MLNVIKRKSLNSLATSFFIAGLLAAMAMFSFAQEGHPLDGTWSGDRTINGDKVRVLLIMRLLPDQTIEGTLIENGARIPLTNITLHHENWSVSIRAQGKNRAGEAVDYRVEGAIENLGSTSERMVVGTWRDGSSEGPFSIRMN